MIPVEFDIQIGDPDYRRYSINYFLDSRAIYMPWLEYLREHAYDIHVDKFYVPQTHTDRLRIRFYLEDKHETFYRLKFSS